MFSLPFVITSTKIILIMLNQRISLIFFIFISFSLLADEQTKYEKTIAELEALADSFPHFARVISMGRNDQGLDILGLEISSNASYENTINQLVIGTHHGNEVDAAPLSLEFARTLLQSLHQPEDSLFGVITHQRFYVFPVLNISGFNQRRRFEKDAQGVWHDPNRDYPDPCGMSQPFKLQSVQRLSEFVEETKIISAVTVHGYFGSFTYPWGFYTDDDHTHDHDHFHQRLDIASKFNDYIVGTHQEILYPAEGSFEDWAYHQHGIWVSLLEMERGIQNYQNDIYAMMSYFMTSPLMRSHHHEHYGACQSSFSRMMTSQSRP